jgi:hypothetical protein
MSFNSREEVLAWVKKQALKEGRRFTSEDESRLLGFIKKPGKYCKICDNKKCPKNSKINEERMLK